MRWGFYVLVSLVTVQTGYAQKSAPLFGVEGRMMRTRDSLLSEQSWFADGYHGGVYGHYPKWQTAFMMEQLAENPDWRLNLELEPETFDSLRIWDPEGYECFVRFVTEQDGKLLEFTNPTYSQPYTYNISGESLIRQFSFGIRKLRSHFPGIKFTTYSVEEPCFTSALPQILKGFGLKYAVLKNPGTCFGGYTGTCDQELVRWIGPDGTAIPTVPRYACEKLMKTSTWQTTAWNNATEYLEACRQAGFLQPIGMCYQDAGWKNGPWLGSPSKSRSRYTLWSDYISTLESTQSVKDWKFSQEDVLVCLMWGSQVLQRIAQQIRKSEQLLVQTEKLISLAGYCGKGDLSSSSLEEAWRKVLMAQHHDCWIVPYNQMSNTGQTWTWNVGQWTAEADRICQQKRSQVAQVFSPANQMTPAFQLANRSLTLGKKAVASSVAEEGKIPENVTDGKQSTRWISDPEDREWIYVDLGEEKEFDQVKVIWEAAYGKAYQLQVSSDLKNWTTVFEEKEGNGKTDWIDLPLIKARYVKMQGVKRGTWGYSIWRFEVYPPDQEELSDVHFICLSLTDLTGKILSENWYWRGGEEGDYTGLNDIPEADFAVTTEKRSREGRCYLKIKITNNSTTPAFAVRTRLENSKNRKRILPVFMDDNYQLILGERQLL